MKIFNLVFLVSFFLAGCVADDSGIECSVLQSAPAISSQREGMLNAAVKAQGKPYVWGGQSLETGFDCSGLMVWAASESDSIKHWLDSTGRVVSDVTADVLYRYNSQALPLSSMAPGDIIFFDADSDGVMEHSAYFVESSQNGESPLVFDAYSVTGVVGYRYVDEFWSKNPFFARLEVIETFCD